MRITRLVAENFRGFERLELDFPSRCTVLVGTNGSGKTTVLDALVRSIHAVHHAPRTQASESDWPWDPALDVGSGAIDALISTTLELPGSGAVELHARITTDASRPSISQPSLALESRVPHILLAPASTDHLVASQGLLRHLDPRAFRPFFLDWESDEDRQRLAGDGAFRDPTLQAIRSALRQIWQDVSVTSVHKRRELEITKQGKRFLFPQLSSGEQRVLTLVGEVARLLAQDRPQDPDAWKRPVVLLADEIEQHLHPVWQRKILPALLGAFPGLQIIATTHSPQVVSSVGAESVVVLHEGKAHAVEGGTKGHETRQILREIFGDPGRDPAVHAELRTVRKCLDRGDLVKARALLDDLENEGRVEREDGEILGLRAEAFTLAGE